MSGVVRTVGTLEVEGPRPTTRDDEVLRQVVRTRQVETPDGGMSAVIQRGEIVAGVRFRKDGEITITLARGEVIELFVTAHEDLPGVAVKVGR